MVFDINNKVALVTGGASGIGLRYSKELLRNGARGVTLADVDSAHGKNALEEIEAEFGPNKVIFVQTDVTNKDQFEDAFKKTIETFKNVDILFNNAGILNDAIWEKEVAINVNGTINGILLAQDNYIAKYKSGEEGAIINISSIAGVDKFPVIPIYTATKFAVHGLTISFGDEYHYKRNKVKIIGVCPGVTHTPLITQISGRNLGPDYEPLLQDLLTSLPIQSPEQCADGVIKALKIAPSGTMWVVEAGNPPYEYVLPNRETFNK
ncbi:unnamed protein product [Brassicogethes aeneus]|uniref:15-hydroxyprostaglandin dehydrogenase [NAD(+)]-like n=1 Tax=Brassicogethes aeneus TaxID=1431903 RepID=A0A9P0AS28_BRAAE|nr:unnamed protein product [Brassicogethes aeneus]